MEPQRRAVAHPRSTLAATILGSSVAFIDGSVVNVGLPALAGDLHADPARLSWTINAYLLPLGALILLGGGLGDHFGRRGVFLTGLSIFLAASILCAAAPSLGWLLAGRAAQGLGASMLMPNSLAILGASFQGEAQGRAIGTWAAVGALAGAIGPVLGGWLIDVSGWRVIFWLNVPVAAAAIWLAVAYVEESRAENDTASLDSSGALLATLALGALTFALTDSATVEARDSAWRTAALGTVALAAFLRHEGRRGETALLPPSLFRSRAFLGLNLLTFFLYGSLGGLLVLLPYFLIRIEGWSAVAAGAALLPIPVMIGAGSRFMGRWAARHGGRGAVSLGALIVGLGLALFVRIGGEVDYWKQVLPPTFLVALGMSICVAPLTAGVMASVDPNRVGIASAFNSAVARIAGLLATALLTFVFARSGSSEDFTSAFHAAAWIGAASSGFAAACAYGLLAEPTRPAR